MRTANYAPLITLVFTVSFLVDSMQTRLNTEAMSNDPGRLLENYWDLRLICGTKGIRVMFMYIAEVLRRASRRWRAACIKNDVVPIPKPQLILENTNFSEDLQHTAIEVTSQALEKCHIENEIATFIKMYFDTEMGPTWHCIVGRNFGSHIAYESYIHFTIAKVTILLFKCG